MSKSYDSSETGFEIEKVVRLVDKVQAILAYSYQGEIFQYSFSFQNEQVDAYILQPLIQSKRLGNNYPCTTAIQNMYLVEMWGLVVDYEKQYSRCTKGDGACIMNSSYQIVNKSGSKWSDVSLPKTYWRKDFPRLLKFTEENYLNDAGGDFLQYINTLYQWQDEYNSSVPMYTFGMDETFGYYFLFEKYHDMDGDDIPKILFFVDETEEDYQKETTSPEKESSKKQTSRKQTSRKQSSESPNKKDSINKMRLRRVFPNIGDNNKVDWNCPTVDKTSWSIEAIKEAMSTKTFVVLAQAHFFEPKVEVKYFNNSITKRHYSKISQELSNMFDEALAIGADMTSIEFEYSMEVVKQKYNDQMEPEFRKY